MLVSTELNSSTSFGSKGKKNLLIAEEIFSQQIFKNITVKPLVFFFGPLLFKTPDINLQYVSRGNTVYYATDKFHITLKAKLKFCH
jgi:hypothetical protein